MICIEGSPGEEDLVIFSREDGKRLGIGEVKADVSGDHESLSRELVRFGGSLQPLPAGSGTWNIQVQPTFNVKKHLKSTLDEVLLHANTNSLKSWAAGTLGGSPDSLNLARLKVQSYSQIFDDGDRAFIHNATIHGWVPPGAPDVNPWLRNLLSRKNFKNSLSRLANSKVQQRHLFIWIEKDSPQDLFLAAKFQPETIPTSLPELPSHITHLWIGLGIFPNNEVLAWKFEPDFGWSIVVS